MSEPSIFRGIVVSLLRPVIGSNFEIEWRTQTNSRRIQMIVQIFHFKLNSIYWKFDFHSHHRSCIIGKHQYKCYVYTILLIAHFLYFSTHCFRLRPLFRFSHRPLVHRWPSSKSHCSRLFLFWISFLSKRVIWLAERTQAVGKGHHLVLHSSASDDLFYKYTPNIFKITQVKP